MNIFIAESSIGSHVPCLPEIDAKLISFTFRASFFTLANPIEDICQQTHVKVSKPKNLKVDGLQNPDEVLDMIYGGDIIGMIKALHLKNQKGYIYLGHDFDANGNLMSSLLYHHLLHVGVEDEYLIRVPLIQSGYEYPVQDINTSSENSIGEENEQRYLNIGFGEFYSARQTLNILETDRLEQIMMNTKSRTRMGYRNMFAMEHFSNKGKGKNQTVEKISDGTCNATYITKMTIGERY